MKILRSEFVKNLPKPIKFLIWFIFTITILYWLGILTYRILWALRYFLHWVSEERNWWAFIFWAIICFVITILILQFCTKVNPIGNLWDKICDGFDSLRNFFGKKLIKK